MSQLTFLFLVLRTWKGNICLLSGSHATDSVSMMQEVTPCPNTYRQHNRPIYRYYWSYWPGFPSKVLLLASWIWCQDIWMYCSPGYDCKPGCLRSLTHVSMTTVKTLSSTPQGCHTKLHCTYLGSFSIVFVFTDKCCILKAFEHFPDAFGWMG